MASFNPRSPEEARFKARWASWETDTLSGRALECFKISGDAFFFELFYTLSKNRIERLVSRFPGAFAWSYNHAEMTGDIFSDVFVFAKTFTFKGPSSFRAWLSVLAHNRMRKEIRSFRKRPKDLFEQMPRMTDEGTGDPLVRLIRKEELRLQWQCWWILLQACLAGIGGISNQEKKVIRLHEFQGLTYREISKRSRRSLKEVAVISRRGRRKVARHIRRVLANHFAC